MSDLSTANSTPTRPSAWAVFLAGLVRMLRCWPLVLLFYAALLLVAGLLLLPLAQGLIAWIGHRLAAGEIAAGLPGWLVTEMMMGFLENPDAIQPAGDWPLLLLLSLPAWPFFLAVPSTLLSAGALAVYADDAPRTDWRRLGRGIARHGPAFLLLLFLEVMLYELALLLTVLLTALVVAVSRNAWSMLLITPILALVVVALPWWFEYARALAVVEGRRNVFQALGQAFTFLVHNLGPAAALAVYHFMLALLPYLLAFLLAGLVPRDWWIVQIVVQQAIVGALLATRLARLAGQVRFVQSRAASSGTVEAH